MPQYGMPQSDKPEPVTAAPEKSLQSSNRASFFTPATANQKSTISSTVQNALAFSLFLYLVGTAYADNDAEKLSIFFADPGNSTNYKLDYIDHPFNKATIPDALQQCQAIIMQAPSDILYTLLDTVTYGGGFTTTKEISWFYRAENEAENKNFEACMIGKTDPVSVHSPYFWIFIGLGITTGLAILCKLIAKIIKDKENSHSDEKKPLRISKLEAGDAGYLSMDNTQSNDQRPSLS